MPLHKVCAASEILTEKATKFVVHGQDILFAKSSDNRIFAFDAICTHADKSLEKGKWNPKNAEITCPFHKAIFAIAETGAVKAPPAFSPLPVYKTEIKQENNIDYVFIYLD